MTYRVAQKKLFFFSSKSFVLHVFPYFSSGVDSRARKFFRCQYGSKWALYCAVTDKNYRGVTQRKISSSDTAAIQENFLAGTTYLMEGKFKVLAKFRKTGSVADSHKDRDHSSFRIILENIQNLRERQEDLPRKSTRRLHKKLAF